MSQAAETPAPETLWDVVRDAVRGGHHHDYTDGPLGRSILLLAVPMVLEMVMESIFAVTDVFFVAKLGADAIATVGLTESLMTIMYTVAIGLSIGVGAMVARRIGEKDPDAAAHTAVQGITIGMALAAILGVFGALFAPQLLRLMGASDSVIATGSTFARIMLGGNVVVILLFLINAVFRGAGDAAFAMRVLWFANAINIVLGPLLVFGVGPFPKLGVTGAAIGTTIGRGAGVCFALWHLFKPNGRVTVTRRHVAIDPALMMRIIRLSATGTLQIFIGSASWIGLVKIVSMFGSAAVAGYTIGIRVVLFALLPSWGLSNAAATMVGQALGAGKPERAERAVWRAGFYNLCFLGAIGLLFVLFAGPIVSVFTQEPEVASHATLALRIIAAGFLFYAYGMVITQSFNGAGDTWTPTWLNFAVFWMWELPLAWWLSVKLGWGPTGVFASVTIAFSTLAVVSALLFRRGTWKTRTV